MPPSPEFGPSVTLYEVTASGIDQNWDEVILNSNRLRVRTADYRGDGVFDKECNFPFVYEGVTYHECTMVDEPAPWCSIRTYASDQHMTGEWGYCLNASQELVQEMSFSNEETCSDQVAHVCTAQANYGVVSVNWTANSLTMEIMSPHEDVASAVAHTISLGESNGGTSHPVADPTASPTAFPSDSATATTLTPTTHNMERLEICPPYFSASGGAGCVFVHQEASNRGGGQKSCTLFGDGLVEVRDESASWALTKLLVNSLPVDASFWHPSRRKGPYIALAWSPDSLRWEWPNGDPLGSYAPWREGEGGVPTERRYCVATTYDGSWINIKCMTPLWALCSIVESPSPLYRILESTHPYSNNMRTRRTVAFPGGVSCYRVKFDDASSSHSKWDFLKVMC